MAKEILNSTNLFDGYGIDQAIIDNLTLDKMERMALHGKEMNEGDLERQYKAFAKTLESEVNLSQVYPPNEFLFDYREQKFITRADLCTIGAKQKAGKSTLIRLLIAAGVSGSWNKLRCLCPGMQMVILDTEQKPVDSQNALKQIVALTGLSEEEITSKVHIYNMRKLTPDEMKEGIPLLLERHHPALLAIDGLVDLCRDFNDVEASQELVIEYLLKLAEKYNCAIISVLHTNKTDNYTELRGHLGAFLGQKGSSVIKCVKDEKSNIVTVTYPSLRYNPVDDWYFGFDENGMPIDAEEQFLHAQAEAARSERERKMAEKDKVDRERKNVILDIINTNAGSALRKDVLEKFTKRTNVGETIFKNLVKEMTEANPAELFKSGPNNRVILSTHPIEEIPGL